MQPLPVRETAFLYAVIIDVALDLGDRGLLRSTEACTLVNNLKCLATKGADPLLRDLPCIGKALDAYLLTDASTDRNRYQAVLEDLQVSAVPVFGTELLSRLLDSPSLDPSLVRGMREVCYLYYKYEAPYDEALVQAAVDKFMSTDASISPLNIDTSDDAALLERCFRGLDLTNVHPVHGGGAVSYKEIGPAKYDWSYLPERLLNVYSYDYFVASFCHLTEVLAQLQGVSAEEPSARVVTVAKDSRGPRVISCEPKEFQWVQQGIMDALVKWIERHPITRNHVRFTNQDVNGKLALQGSLDGSWATLDLSEASDRVSLEYVEKVFPETVRPYVLACRSLSTKLPGGEVVILKKFAPMGSACCFPILAMTCFARLRAVGIHACHVYGDDVIVPQAQAHLAITALEAIGLKVNMGKSCMSGLFRESCGVDAYRGYNVTPLRIKERWTSRRSPNHLTSYCEVANALWGRGYTRASERIARELSTLYGPIPMTWGEALSVPHLRFIVEGLAQPRSRSNKRLQYKESLVWTTRAKAVPYLRKDSYMLLHWLSQAGPCESTDGIAPKLASPRRARRVGRYTVRRSAILKKDWVNLLPVKG